MLQHLVIKSYVHYNGCKVNHNHAGTELLKRFEKLGAVINYLIQEIFFCI